MSMFGTMMEVAAIDTLMHADTRSPNRQNYNPLRMMQAVLCFEAMEALVGPVAGVALAEGMMGNRQANTPQAQAAAVRQQPRAQQRPGLSYGLNGPAGPAGGGM